MMTGKLEWELIHTEYGDAYEAKDRRAYVETTRSPVPGGWLVRVISYTYTGIPDGSGITFVPDPEHTWSVA